MGEDDEAIDHVEEEGVVDPVVVVEEEEGVAAGEVNELADPDPAITNSFLEPGPSQPPVLTRDSLTQRLQELQTRSGLLTEELDAISQETLWILFARRWIETNRPSTTAQRETTGR